MAPIRSTTGAVPEAMYYFANKKTWFTGVALHPGVWAVFVAHIAFNFGAYYMTNWNPTYYADVLGVAAPLRARLARRLAGVEPAASRFREATLRARRPTSVRRPTLGWC